MRILVLCSKLPYPPKDGGAIATGNLLKGLASHGFEITLLSFNTRKHYFPPENIPDEIKEQISIITVDADTSISLPGALRNLLFSRKPYVAQRFEHDSFRNQLTSLIKERIFDIIQLEGPYFESYLTEIRKYSKARVVVRAHNIEHEIWNRRWKQEKNPLRRMYLRNLSNRIQKLETDLLQAIDALLPISERDGLLFHELNPNLKQHVVPTGIDIDSYAAINHDKIKDLFFIGALDWIPNQEGLKWFIREILPRLERSNPSLSIHIAGRNALKDGRKLFRHSMIKFHGEVDDAKAYMQEHGIMLVPLFTGSGIRIKILEGMALEKCIITTTVGAEGIPAEHGKHLFIANDPEVFHQTILKVLEDESLVRRIGSEAKKLVQEKFDTFAITSGLGEFYNKLA
ncbi:glycosyltransferase family 4 protein [Bacteroidota bacterium]